MVNPMIKVLLRSPLHRILSKQVMLLSVTGRRTGRTYTVPVGRHPSGDGTYFLSAAGSWRHNLRGGAEVRLTIAGREHRAHAVIEEDPDRAAEAFMAVLERDGARPLGVKLSGTRAPTPADIKPVLSHRSIAYLRLVD